MAIGSWAWNPLDRVAHLYLLTRDIRVIRWVNHQAGGFFVANPALLTDQLPAKAVADASHVLTQHFAELLTAMTNAGRVKEGVGPEQSTEIRIAWEELKDRMEQFVIACERGQFFSWG